MGYLVGAWNYAFHTNWGDWSVAFYTQVAYSVLALAIGTAICVPLGILASRNRIISFSAVNLFGTVRAIPSIAILFLLSTAAIQGLRSGFELALVALTILVCPPILVNTAAGFAGVDTAVVESARGMGMSGWQVLWRIEFPLALPVVLAGVRTGALEGIASATLATYIGGGGLGDLIVQGLADQQNNVLFAGAIPVALLALFAEVLFGGLQRALTPLGVAG